MANLTVSDRGGTAVSIKPRMTLQELDTLFREGMERCPLTMQRIAEEIGVRQPNISDALNSPGQPRRTATRVAFVSWWYGVEIEIETVVVIRKRGSQERQG